jgi:hypothetical protein
MYWLNTVDGYCKGKEELCQKILEHVNENSEWVKYKIKHHRSSDAYWHQVKQDRLTTVLEIDHAVRMVSLLS